MARTNKTKRKKSNLKSENRMPVVGDLMYSLETGRLAYCEGYIGNTVLMTFPGNEVPNEYTVNEIKTRFKY